MDRMSVCVDKIPDDFEPLGTAADLSEKFPIGLNDSFIYMANLNNDKQRLSALAKAVQDWFKEAKPSEGRIPLLISSISRIVDKKYVDFFASIIWWRAKNPNKKEKKVDGNYSYLMVACDVADMYANFLCDPDEIAPTGRKNKDCIVSSISAMNHYGLAFDLKYNPIMGYCGDRFTFLNAFILTDALSVVNMAAIIIINENTAIHRCAHCGDYFIPASRSDEIYCDKRLPNGKTCKNVGYEKKVEKDDVLREYRKIYKTQNARKQRNQHRPNIEANFDRWKAAAKMALNSCQSGNIALAEMIERISGTAWMEGIFADGQHKED